MSGKEMKTRSKVCRAFIALLAQQPYHSISVSLLTRCAGVSRTAFYNNFDSLDAVAIAIYEYSFQHIFQDKFSQPGYIVSPAYIRDTIEYFDTFSVFLHAMERQEIAGYFHLMVNRRIQGSVQADDLLTAEQMDYGQAFFLSPLFHICTLWIRKGKKESREELQRICEGLYEKARWLAQNED